ncbi:3-oxoacyl-ACP reductase family protein [Candidatus Tachikawaea gelatinosa]|uniref:3-oxoacyl-[acyl-carrier-protein] reductase n=1 Tax=Candidatus Tachikawaea gelatinosa TaxID=1410383 RepID=A0A090AR34_9ENTR|nr:3-oxoacyl-ACP reductase family protein [Candidatus Tachikawaea gelatinosa]BAP58807.1 3-oxoacyl-(Acyl-carrier-protein) reductase [Candidatus Tachikawaea gelatinosa]
MSLKDKIALVTGATKGIGKAIAKKLTKKGAIVIGTATTEDGAKTICNYLKNEDRGIVLNINDDKKVEYEINRIHNKFEKVDILVNNAAIHCDKLFFRMKYTEWKNVLDTNLYSIFFITKSILRYMLKKHIKGRIVNISSVVASIGNIGQTNYSASKAGLIGFSKSLAREVAPFGINVNVVSPGYIETNMTNNIKEDQRSAILKHIPLGRLGNVDEVANVVSFLVSNESSYITGETLHVNGGMYMV